MMEIIDCEQGTEEWRKLRCGLPTASMFSTVLASGKGGGESKTRNEYLRKLAGEIITGEPMESYSNAYMERGRMMEDEARSFYSFMYDVEPVRVGFIRNGNKGCSPDSLIGDNRGLEIKTATAHIQIERLLRDDLPPEHKAQVQGNLWVSEREEWDFVSYWPKLPMLVKRIARDEPYIEKLAAEVDRFNAELAEMVERIKKYGVKQ